jgi:hypothetical protein
MNDVTIIRTQAEIADAPTTVLIATYNALTGKNVTKFSSRAAGEAQVANAILKGQDNAAHAGVPKGTDDKAIKAITEEEAAAKAADPVTTTTTEGTNVKTSKTNDKQLSREEIRAKRFPTAAAQEKAAAATAKKAAAPAKKAAAPAKKAAAPAKKAPAKKAAAPAKKEARASATYQFIKSTTPDVPRRPQAESTRTKVLTAIQELGKGGKKISMDALDEKCGFNTRPFVHKLARNGWCEVVGSDKS